MLLGKSTAKVKHISYAIGTCALDASHWVSAYIHSIRQSTGTHGITIAYIYFIYIYIHLQVH